MVGKVDGKIIPPILSKLPKTTKTNSKKNCVDTIGLRHGLCGGLCIALLLLAASAAAQQTIVFNGEPELLRAITSAALEDLAPTGEYQQGGLMDGWSHSLNDNLITVNASVPGGITGAFYCIAATTPPGPFPAEVTGNKIIVNNGTVGGLVLGAHVEIVDSNNVSTAVKDNHVTVENGTIGQLLIGAAVRIASSAEAQAVAVANSITMNGGKVEFGVYGGNVYVAQAETARITANENTVTITGGEVGEHVYGGFAFVAQADTAADVTANENTVTMSDGKVGRNVTGGYAYVAQADTANVTANENTVTISGGEVGGYVYGGYAFAVADTAANVTANENTVLITGGSVTSNIFGGYAIGGDAVGNTVTLNSKGGEVWANIYGGSSGGGNATGNTVNIIEGGGINRVIGGDGHHATSNTVHFGKATAQEVIGGIGTVVDDNTVNINAGGTVTGGLSSVAGGSTSGSASNNTVNINAGGTVEGTVYGSINQQYSVEPQTHMGNTVNVKGGTVTESVVGAESLYDFAYGNFVNIYSGDVGSNSTSSAVIGGSTTNSGDVEANEVHIFGGTITGHVTGGYATDGNAAENIVKIGGDAAIAGNVYGGRTGYSGIDGGNAIDNIVDISGTPTFTDTILYGGHLAGDGTLGFTSSGNVLNWGSKGIMVEGVQDFQILNFYLTEDVMNGDVLLTASGVVNIGNVADENIMIYFAEDNTALEPGDIITLIDAGTLTQTISEPFTVSGGTPGAKIEEYEFEIRVEDQVLLAELKHLILRPDDHNKILSAHYLTGIMLLNQTGDLLENRIRQHQCGWFADITGSRSRYNTGSHVDITGFSLTAGLTKCTRTMPGKMTYGAFFEYGNGGDLGLYAEGVRGGGKIDHYGGGILARQNFGTAFYADGLFRIGGIDSRFHSGDLRDRQGNATRYDSSSAYIGTQFGLGSIRKITARRTLDLYSKYLWTHQNSDRVTLSTGEPVRFESINSHRLRLGGRSNYTVNRRVSTYVGAAWDYEFDGAARATANGFDIAAPSLRGSTGMGELGMSLRATSTMPLAFDLGVQGYTGKREGVAGSLQVRWAW